MFAGFRTGAIAAPPPFDAPDLRAHAILQATAAPRLDRGHIAFAPGLYGNDEVGDCTCVTLANLLRGQASTRGFDVQISTDQVLALYGRWGYQPGKPLTDRGAIPTEVLASQLRDGFEIAQPAPAAGLWASIDPGDFNGLRNIAARTGGAYLGVQLAEADQSLPEGGVWDTDTPTSRGDPHPGSWACHALMLWDYAGTGDDDWVRLATFGQMVPATWRWLRSRLEEAHMVVWRQFGDVIGLDWPRLQADCGVRVPQIG